ncbi:MAG: hypothetical protein KDB01_11045 [Planctomycetaceae bacterium]|nr:hypothetical protein [Planctomycetaceae bacterium]
MEPEFAWYLVRLVPFAVACNETGVAALTACVEIVIPENIDISEPQSLMHYFQILLNDAGSGLSQALDLSCDQKTTHAIVENVTINQVRVAGDLIHMEYDVELSEFQACQDLTTRYCYTRTVVGTRSGRHCRFDKFVPLPERSTYDEL